MSERASLSAHHRELMLSLAYLGGLTYALTLRLLPCYSTRTLQRDLADLRKLGDVEKHAIYKPGPKGRSVKLYDVWTLTDKGHAYIAAKASDQYPTKPAKLRHKRVMQHDLLAIETIVALIEQARQEGLSGLFVQCEMRLNPSERRPIPDAVVIMQFGGGFNRTDIVPWTRDPAIEDETRSRFVIEADYQTETLSVIAGKARAYETAFHNPEWLDWWAAQFGPLPIVIWVIADKEDDPQPAIDRLTAIFRMWGAEWLNGYWIGTTQSRMEKKAWAVYAKRTWGWYTLTTLQTERRVVDEHRRQTLPGNNAQSSTGTVTDARSAPMAPKSTMVRDTNSITTTVTPVPVPQPTGAVSASIVSVDSTTAANQRTTSLSRSEGWTHRTTPVYYYPTTYVPPKPAYVPPAPRYPEPWWYERLAWIAQDVFYEIYYAILRPFQLLGIVWIVRACIRLTIWFFRDEVYIFAGLALVMLMCLGGVGWLGYIGYRTYQADPLFSFTWETPTPTAVVVIPVVPPPQPQRDLQPAPPEQPTLPPTCGVAHVTSEGLNLRRTPRGQVLTVLFRGQEVTLLCAVEHLGTTTWVYVRANQREGWVSERYLDISGSGNRANE